MTTAELTPVADAISQLHGPNVLLIGPAGTGKTHSLGKLVECAAAHGKQVCVLFTEDGLDTLLGYWKDRGLDVPMKLAWHQTLTKPLGILNLMKAADYVGKLSYKALTEMSDPNRSGDNKAFLKILTAL